MRELLILAAALLVYAGGAAATPINGIFALQGGHASTSAHLVATQVGNDALDRHLDLWFTPTDSDRAIRSFDVDMTKYLHLVVVSDDLRTFLHVHPTLEPNGHFVIDQRLPRATGYHLYADIEPHGIGQQVFRFDLSLGGRDGSPDLQPTGTSVSVGPYVATISADVIKADSPVTLIAHIRKNGAPANDLHPYLGALAHAIFLNTADLSYLHVHPMALGKSGGDMNMSMPMDMDAPPLAPGSAVSPDMQLQVASLVPGVYRLWLQFRGGTTLYAAPFIITAR